MKSIPIVAAAAVIGSGVSGCVPVIGTLTLNDLMTGTSLMATALTGKSLSDHALSVATGKDCSLMDAVLEKDRHICEANGSKATEGEFKGLLAMGGPSKVQPQTEPEPQVQPQPQPQLQPQPRIIKVAADRGTVPVASDVPLGLITARVPTRELPAVVAASAEPQPDNSVGAE